MSVELVLVLENGRLFRGQSVGPVSEAYGEVVFNTSLSGYQEILSDPSYAGQIVVMTAPHIGNTGVNDVDMEGKVACVGLVMREASPVASSWRSQGSLQDFLIKHEVAGIDGLDTRALTRVLRDEGAMRGVISADVDNVEGLLQKIRNFPKMQGRDLASGVSSKEEYVWQEKPWVHSQEQKGVDSIAKGPTTKRSVESPEKRVFVYDFGTKHNILRDLRGMGCHVTVIPSKTSAKDVLSEKPDGIFLSNGPGDPEVLGYAIEAVQTLCTADVPIFGICLGHQILALALGAQTYKLPFGHHGSNHPVLDLQTRKVEITSQNHGFAVDEKSLPTELRCTHINLFDNTIEGIAVVDKPIFSVQYHPEASPGPRDASYLFQRFADKMNAYSS